MKSKFIGALRALLNWLTSDQLLLVIPKDELFEYALDLVGAHDVFAISGEAKRHQVYAQLLKDFPSSPKRTIALAIEAALSTLS